MARRCTVCSHPDRPAVDRSLVDGRDVRDLAACYEVSKSAVDRHRASHLPAALAQARAAAVVAQADDLLDEVQRLKARAVSILDAAEQKGKYAAAIMALREARSCIELLAEMARQIDRRPTLNLLVAPEWVHTRTALLEALRPYPEARLAVAARLEALEAP
jgi:hypothetical protein